MPANVERQRVMIPHVRMWEEWRAVCWDHPKEWDEVVPPWMAHDTHPEWIFAMFDATAHDFQMHPSAHPVPRVHELFPERKSDG